MNRQLSRREILGTAGAVLLPPAAMAAAGEVEVELSPVSAHTFRLTVGGAPADDGALVQPKWGAPSRSSAEISRRSTVKAGGVSIQLSSNPLALAIVTAKGEPVQQIKIDPDTGAHVVRHRELRRCSAWARAGRSSTGADPPTACAAGRADINCAPSAGACPYSGWSAPAAGRCSSTRPTARSISPGAESKFLPPSQGRRAAARPVLRDIEGARGHHGASTRASPGMPSCRRCGASAISSRIARWRAARQCWRRPRPSARRSCPATR